MALKKEKGSYDERLHNSNFIDACNNAVNGIVYSTSSQTNIRKQLILGAIVLILSLFYDFSTTEFLSLTFAIFFVIFAEMINTAIETLVDLYTDVYHPKAKIAKDVAAGAVLFASVNSVIVAYFLIIKQTDLIQLNQSILGGVIASPTHMAFVGLILVTIWIISVKSISKKIYLLPSSKVYEAIISSSLISIFPPIFYMFQLLFVIVHLFLFLNHLQLQ